MNIPRRCPTVGCREYVPCAKHRPDSTVRGYDHRWARTRRLFLAENPDCERCGAHASEVDHRDGRGPNGPNGYAWWNLQALCKSCHSRLTRADQG